MTLLAPDYIRGLHFFCDHRCWRCSLSRRCRVFALLEQRQSNGSVPASPAARVAAAVLASMQVTIEEAGEMLARAPASLDTPIEPDTYVVEEDPGAEQDPLVRWAKEYAGAGLRVLQVLRPRLEGLDDAEASDAAVRLEETCVTIATKIFRAVSGAGKHEGLQCDANGSAKVALLLIEESRRAWQMLMRQDRAYANGVPARLVAMLDGLETSLLRRFPGALRFIRPGFDTDNTNSEAGRLSAALLNAAAATNGNAS